MVSFKPRTLLISPYFDADLPSGGAVYSIDVAREWLDRGRSLDVICIDRPRSLAPLQAHVESGQLVLHPLVSEDRARFTHHPSGDLCDAARSLIQTIEPDLIHVHNTQGMISAIEAAVDSGIPTVLTALDFGMICLNFCLFTGTAQICNGPGPRKCAACIGRTIRGPAKHFGPILPRALTRRIWPRFVRLDQIKSAADLQERMQRILTSLDAIIAPSPGLAERLRAYVATPDRVTHLLYGVSPERIVHPAKEPTEPLRLGYVGGLDPIKGFDTIVTAAEMLPPHLPLQIRAFGGEPLCRFIEECSSRARSYVHWQPGLSANRMSEHARIDAMLVPSIVHENSPFAVLESLANGTPVIGSDEPGISHLIAPEYNGWIIPAGQPAAWAATMQDAALEPERIRAMQSTTRFRRTTAEFVDDVQKIEMQLCRRVPPPTPAHRAAHAPRPELVPMR